MLARETYTPPMQPDQAWCACYGDDARECSQHRESDEARCSCPCHRDESDPIGIGI